MLYMLAVQAATKFVQLPRKPPVTTTLIAVQTFIHLRPGKFDDILPTLSEVCLNPHFVLKVREGSFILSPILCCIIQNTHYGRGYFFRHFKHINKYVRVCFHSEITAELWRDHFGFKSQIS